MSKRLNVLIVEDHEPEWQLYRDGLADGCYACEFCKWGEEALAKAKTNTYDLIFFDLGLPQTRSERAAQPMDDLSWGKLIFSKIKELHAGPTVIVTSHRNSIPGSSTIQELKPSACLAKVVTPDEIREAAANLLRARA